MHLQRWVAQQCDVDPSSIAVTSIPNSSSELSKSILENKIKKKKKKRAIRDEAKIEWKRNFG
jgi:hypothetical protein